jgi:hypothetical protein
MVILVALVLLLLPALAQAHPWHHRGWRPHYYRYDYPGYYGYYYRPHYRHYYYYRSYGPDVRFELPRPWLPPPPHPHIYLEP